MDKEAEGKIQKITRMLEKGGTMLASHHECGAPMFRYQGKTACPVCDFREEHEERAEKGIKKEIKAGQELKKDYKKEPEPGAIKAQPAQETQAEQAGDYQAINRIITKKILDIAVSLESETDLQRVKNKMDCIEQGIKITKLLQD